MTRATPADVKLIVETSLEDPIIQLWIDIANGIVTSKAGCIGGDEDLLTKVEINLSAHFIALLNPGGGGAMITSEKAEKLSTSYAVSAISDSINTTVYGMAANAASGGCLATYDKPKATVEFF